MEQKSRWETARLWSGGLLTWKDKGGGSGMETGGGEDKSSETWERKTKRQSEEPRDSGKSWESWKREKGSSSLEWAGSPLHWAQPINSQQAPGSAPFGTSFW